MCSSSEGDECVDKARSQAYAQTCDEPCAQVSAQWAAQRAANATARVVVDGQLAYDCLTSVPLNEENAVRLVRSIQPFLDWQSSELEPGPGHFSTDELTHRASLVVSQRSTRGLSFPW